MRALIIDDSRTTRAIISRLLTSIGYETAEAEHGRAALDYLEANGASDIAFVDWNMPEMTGIEFVRHARQNARYDGMQIVMVTSENEISAISQALEAGANEYLMKPFTKEGLEEKIALLSVQ